MSSAPAPQAGWARLAVSAYLAPLWGGGHAVVAPASAAYAAPALGALLAPLRARGMRSGGRGLRIDLLAAEGAEPDPALSLEAVSALEAALFREDLLRDLVSDGPGSHLLRGLPILRLGLWFPIIWGVLLLLGSGGHPAAVAAALWLMGGLPASVAWYRRRRLLAFARAAQHLREALWDTSVPVRVLHHPGMAELRSIIAAAPDPVHAYRAAAARCAWCGVPSLEPYYSALADDAERERPAGAPMTEPVADSSRLGAPPGGDASERAAQPASAPLSGHSTAGEGVT